MWWDKGCYYTASTFWQEYISGVYYFSIEPCYLRKIIHAVILDWIIGAKIADIDTKDYLDKTRAMQRVSYIFSKRSRGALKGEIRALYWWVVCIIHPRWRNKKALIFYSRKGFMSLTFNTSWMTKNGYCGIITLTTASPILLVVSKRYIYRY